MEDFNNYPSKYPRLPTLEELQKIKNNNFMKTTETNYNSREYEENINIRNNTNNFF